MEEDRGVGRVIEAQGLANIFLSLFDELKKRKFSRVDAVNISREMIFSFMDYKSSMDALDSEPEGMILFTPEGGTDV